MKKLFTLFFAGGAAAAASAQCNISISKSGTGLTRTYTASSAASRMTYTWLLPTSSTGATKTRTYTYGGGYSDNRVAGQVSGCVDIVSLADTVAGPIDCSNIYAGLGNVQTVYNGTGYSCTLSNGVYGMYRLITLCRAPFLVMATELRELQQPTCTLRPERTRSRSQKHFPPPGIRPVRNRQLQASISPPPLP